MNKAGKSEAYRAAGVDIDLATSLLQSVKSKISATRRPEALAPIGGFGGLFQIDLTKWRQPVMVTSIDGVGTKLMIAAMMEKYTTVGYDIVNHCINDIAVQGAEPVYFMDYIGIGKLRSPLYEDVLIGIADACLAMNVTRLGGETAEMPGMYGDDFDLVGCITGIVERDAIITGDNIRPGDIVIGMASSGSTNNGYSWLVRCSSSKPATVDTTLPELGGGKLGDASGAAPLLAGHSRRWRSWTPLNGTPISLAEACTIMSPESFPMASASTSSRLHCRRRRYLASFSAGDIEPHRNVPCVQYGRWHGLLATSGRC